MIACGSRMNTRTLTFGVRLNRKLWEEVNTLGENTKDSMGAMSELMKKLQEEKPELLELTLKAMREKTTFEIARIVATSVVVLSEVTNLGDRERFELVTEVLEECARTAREALADDRDLTPEEHDKARKIMAMFME